MDKVGPAQSGCVVTIAYVGAYVAEGKRDSARNQARASRKAD
jgi:hypothetical protein